MKKIVIVLTTLLFTAGTLSGQEIYIAVYDGVVAFQDGRHLNLNFRYELPKGKPVNFSANTSVVMFTKTKYFFYKAAGASGMTYNAIYDSLKNSSPANSTSFFGYLRRLQFSAGDAEEFTKGGVLGGIKGIDNRRRKAGDENYELALPVDSARMLSGTIRLQWELKEKIFGTRLIVVNIQTKDTVHNSAASNTGDVSLTIEKEGTYNWFLYSSLQKKKKINQVFIKPGAEEVKTAQKKLGEFKAGISALDNLFKELLIEDYLYVEKLVEN